MHETCEANVILLDHEQLTAAKRLEFNKDDIDNGVYHPVGKSTTNQALANSVNILLGVGTLSVPYALRESGWAGIVVLLLLGDDKLHWEDVDPMSKARVVTDANEL